MAPMPDPSLIYENAALQAPGIHALVVGVSDYTYLPEANEPPDEDCWNFNKLTSAALSAYKIYQWIDRRKGELRLPIKSIRLLLAPSPAEKAAEQALQNLNAVVPTWTAFKDALWAWQDAAAKDPNDMTFFYFAGHGMQRGPEEGILLLADFSAPATAKLAHCVMFSDIRAGMAPTDSCPNIAKTQFYFVDACRVTPEIMKKFDVSKIAPIWDTELPHADRREAPVLFSTVDGAIAVGRGGKPSFFAEGLIFAFERGAEEPDDSNGPTVWPVTSMTMKTALDIFYAKNKVGTQVNPGGMVGAPVLRYLPAPPDVDVKIYIRPEVLAGHYFLELCDDDDKTVNRITECPSASVEITIKAGIYRLLVHSDRITPSPYPSKRKSLAQSKLAILGATPWPLDLTPSIPAG
jgi:Caspase domain